MDRLLGIIYKIVSPSGRVYVGQTWNLEKRLRDYRHASNVKNQKLLYHSLRKYGECSHDLEVIDIGFFNQEELDNREIYWIKKLDSKFPESKVGLNLTEGGMGKRGCKPTKEAIEKSRKANLGRPAWNKGGTLKESTKQILREKNTGVNSPVGKLVLDTVMGVYYDTIREAADAKNINESSLRAKLLGYTRRNNTGLVYANEGYTIETAPIYEKRQRNDRLCMNVESGVFFYTLRDASRAVGITESHLSNQLHGRVINRSNIEFV